MTVSELAMTGTPAILVPFPYAVDDHQSANAAYLADGGAAELIQERELSAELLAKRLEALCTDKANGAERLRQMGQSAHKLARADATEVVAQYCVDAMEDGDE